MERQAPVYEIQKDRWNTKKLLRDIKKLFMEEEALIYHAPL